METVKIGSREFDVIEHVTLVDSVTVPLLDIHMMDERRERELAAKSAIAWWEANK